MGQIAELCANPVAFESTELIQHILMFLSRSEDLSKHVDSFMQMLSLVQLKEGAEFVLAPFLPDELRGDNFFRCFPWQFLVHNFLQYCVLPSWTKTYFWKLFSPFLFLFTAGT